jgi:putative endopeptidase
MHHTPSRTLALASVMLCVSAAAHAQTPASEAVTPAPRATVYTPTPGFDLTSIDPKANPCDDFYAFACGKYAANHPIPPDQAQSSSFYNLFNVNTQELGGILDKAEVATGSRTPNEQKIGDYYHACMDTAAIDRMGLKPLEPLLKQIDDMTLFGIATLTGRLQRIGVDVLFSYGEQQDFKDASKQIASIDQGGLGMPERDYYLRTGAKDVELRKDYVTYITKLLTLSGTAPAQAAREADGILQFETALAKASMSITERRDPLKVYHLMPVAEVSKDFPMGMFGQFETAIDSPHVTEINDANPGYLPAMISLVRSTDIATLRAYFRFHLLSSEASNLPTPYDRANFQFYGHDLEGAEQQRARYKVCAGKVNVALGEALGEVYVKQYFAGDSKAKMLQMVGEIEQAMGRDIDSLSWMSAETKMQAHEKLHAVANKIGYPDHWRDYSALSVSPDDAISNSEHANEFENDRELNKIGKPVDHSEWGMTPPTVNAYYDSSMNDINFPAGILQPMFYDPRVDDAVNYGHIGAVIGHELTHGFDDEGKKFDARGNLRDWWTPEDTARFETKTSCLANQYSSYVAIDDQHVNGKLTLGENTADNGGLLLAYMAYLQHAKMEGTDLNLKLDGYTAPQRFYIAWAQNWCGNDRPAALRSQVLTDPHSPDRFRANGPIVNQPGFAGAFSCKVGSPMVPANNCRVW